MTREQYDLVYLSFVLFCLALAIAGVVASWLSWHRGAHRRTRDFLRAYDRAMRYAPGKPERKAARSTDRARAGS